MERAVLQAKLVWEKEVILFLVQLVNDTWHTPGATLEKWVSDQLIW